MSSTYKTFANLCFNGIIQINYKKQPNSTVEYNQNRNNLNIYRLSKLQCRQLKTKNRLKLANLNNYSILYAILTHFIILEVFFLFIDNANMLFDTFYVTKV